MTEKTQQDYVVPFYNAMLRGWKVRTNNALKELKKFVSRHWRNDNIVITGEVNEFIWRRGKFKIPNKIEVTTKKVDGNIRVYLKGSKLIEEEKKKLEQEKKKKEEKKAEKKTEEPKEKEEELKRKQEEKKAKEDAQKKMEIKKG